MMQGGILVVMVAKVLLGQISLPYSDSSGTSSNLFSLTGTCTNCANVMLAGSSNGVGTGVKGYAWAGIGVEGNSPSGTGLYGFVTPDGGGFAGGYVVGPRYGIYASGYSLDGGTGVYGETVKQSGATSGQNASRVGVRGRAYTGVYGVSDETSGNVGVGVSGSGRLYGVYAYSPTWVGMLGEGPAGVIGSGTGSAGNGYGVAGQSTNDNGVIGYSAAWYASGVYGQSNSASGYGVAGRTSNTSGTAVYGDNYTSSGGYAGYFNGRVYATIELGSPSKPFIIDHPQDPANKLLKHVAIEAPEFKTFYDGIVVLDASGQATVKLPGYFEALNTNVRYQLTTIGGYAPVYISKEVANGQFSIAGGTPGLKVSWMLTGVRQDAYVQAHPLQVEQLKSAAERGRYLDPISHGQPASLAMVPGPQATVPAAPIAPGLRLEPGTGADRAPFAGP